MGIFISYQSLCVDKFDSDDPFEGSRRQSGELPVAILDEPTPVYGHEGGVADRHTFIVCGDSVVGLVFGHSPSEDDDSIRV